MGNLEQSEFQNKCEYSDTVFLGKIKIFQMYFSKFPESSRSH